MMFECKSPGSEGALLLLPPLRYDEGKFVRHREKDSVWTKEALQFGKRLASTLGALADALQSKGQETPVPVWTSEARYRLNAEATLENTITECAANIASLQAKKGELESDLRNVGRLRRLLFEQGKPLESAVLESLRILGFQANPFEDAKSEFDAVFVSPEGRCLGEAEGKDSKAVNIEKFSQLERNLQEDFARDEIAEYAKGVLFGNAFRLSPVAERGAFFTDKCLSAAKRVGAALVRTPDLFAPTKYLKENPADQDFAKRCREAIFKTNGEVVTFPRAPVAEESVQLKEAVSRA